MERAQRVYGSLESGAQRKTLNSFALIRGERDGRGEAWVGRVLLLFRCSAKGDSDGNDLEFGRYMECMASLDEVG